MSLLAAPYGEILLNGINGVSMLRRATELTSLDRRLIHALQVDGRVSFATLGPQLGTTEKTVRLRAQELTDAGIIDITVVTNPHLLGYTHMALIGLRVAGGHRAAVVEQLSQIPSVDYIASTVGRYDILVEMLASSVAALAQLVDRHIASIDGVDTIDVYPYLSVAHQQGVFLGSENPSGVTKLEVGSTPVEFELDSVNRAILRSLSDDGRRPFEQIGRELGISGDVVRRRVSRMRDQNAIRVMAITNPMTLGFEVIAVVGIRLGASAKSKDVAAALSGMSAVTYVAICTGGYDLLTEVACQSTSEFQGLMDEIRMVPGVARTESFLYFDLQYRRIIPRTD